MNAGVVRVRCRGGCVWVTQEGDRADYVLQPGEARDFRNAGVVLVQAVEGPAEVELSGAFSDGARWAQEAERAEGR